MQNIDYHSRHKLYEYQDLKFDSKEVQDIFKLIYQDHTWNVETNESVSGEGSNLYQTRLIRSWLPGLLQSMEIRSILDVPCGDFFWMKEVDLHGIKYIGADIVPLIIDQNNFKYKSPDRFFVDLNLITDQLPDVDAIFCRDCLVHFSFADIFKSIENIINSAAKYLMTTTFPLQPGNHDILTGGWRPLNFTLPPFNFPPPDLIFNEGCTEMGGAFHDKSIGIWTLDKL